VFRVGWRKMGKGGYWTLSSRSGRIPQDGISQQVCHLSLAVIATEKIHLRKETCFGSWFHRIRFLYCSGPLVRENIIVAETNSGWSKLLSSWQPGSRERQKKEPGTRSTLHSYALSDLLPPTRPYLSHFYHLFHNAIKL
jgi:hypothetical protein